MNKFSILYVLVLTELLFMNRLSMQVPILSDLVFDGLATLKKIWYIFSFKEVSKEFLTSNIDIHYVNIKVSNYTVVLVILILNKESF